MKNICVFCGSNPGHKPDYVEAAIELGHFLAEEGIGLVYGGSSVGLMAQIAHACLEAGGNATGVIPQNLVELEVADHSISNLYIVKSMHARKSMMADLSDGFIAMPGGIGTLEELFEIWTWGKLGSHAKPCGLLNVSGYYDGLHTFLDQVVDEGFLPEPARTMLMTDATPAGLIAQFREYEPPVFKKWVEKDEL